MFTINTGIQNPTLHFQQRLSSVFTWIHIFPSFLRKAFLASMMWKKVRRYFCHLYQQSRQNLRHAYKFGSGKPGLAVLWRAACWMLNEGLNVFLVCIYRPLLSRVATVTRMWEQAIAMTHQAFGMKKKASVLPITGQVLCCTNVGNKVEWVPMSWGQK